MAEETTPVEGAGDLFDPENFVTKTLLNGKVAVIREADFVRHNYGGKIAETVTALRLRISSDELDKAPKPMLIACGDLWPSTDGKTKSIQGPFLTGGKIDNRSSIADFLKNLKASGFSGLGLKGAHALINEAFLWKSVERRLSKTEVKAYDVPAEYKGHVEAEAPVNLDEAGTPAVSSGVAVSPAPAASAAADEAMAATLREKVLTALTAAGGEIPRGQLSVKIGKEIEQEPRKMDMFGLLIQDKFLASIPGVTFDKKSIKLNTAGAPTADVPAAQ